MVSRNPDEGGNQAVVGGVGRSATVDDGMGDNGMGDDGMGDDGMGDGGMRDDGMVWGQEV